MPEVHETLTQWEQAAETFSRARPSPWPAVLRWAERALAPQARVLDLAAGNGRHGGPLAETGRGVVAVDFARAFAREARIVRGLESVRAEVAQLPFRAASFDGALFVAALHNVPGRHRRITALAEMARVLRPGAPALVTVWARWRHGWIRHFVAEFPHYALGDAHGSFGDAIVPWRSGGTFVPRYYHFYSRPELRADLELAGLEVVRLWGERLAVPRAAGFPGNVLPDNLFVEVRRRDAPRA